MIILRNKLKSNWWQLLLLVSLILLTYGHTLDVPMYFDDLPILRDNPRIRNFFDLTAINGIAYLRLVGNLTFAANYQLHGLDVFGYHLVNIFIHILTSIIVYGLTRQLLKTVPLARYVGENERIWLPLVVALIFALSPLQIQAVTYIIQRLASLAAFFFILSIFFYVQGRLTKRIGFCLVYFLSCGLSALAAFYTKPNTMVLPLVLFLVEVIFFQLRGIKLALVIIGGVILLLSIVGGYYYFIDNNIFAILSRVTKEDDLIDNSRVGYFAIQMGVIWTYLGKFFVPLNQHLDYSIAVVGWSNWKTIVFAIGHLGLIGLALWSIRTRPILAFGILFYYSTHLIESSLIPIRDFAYEHRTYLPNFGLSLIAGWMVVSVSPRFVEKKILLPLTLAAVTCLSGLTWYRNQVWRDPIVFFSHEIKMNPDNIRSWGMLGEAYLNVEDYQSAVRIFTDSEHLFNSFISKKTNTEVAYYSNFVLALDMAGSGDEALALIDRLGIEALDSNVHKSNFYNLRGSIYAKQEYYQRAEKDFLLAIELDPRNKNAKNQYALILILKGEFDEAHAVYTNVLTIDPYDEKAQFGLDYLNTLE